MLLSQLLEFKEVDLYFHLWFRGLQFLFVCLFWIFETEFLCVTALAVPELALVGHAGLELTDSLLSLPPKPWDLRCAPSLAQVLQNLLWINIILQIPKLLSTLETHTLYSVHTQTVPTERTSL